METLILQKVLRGRKRRDSTYSREKDACATSTAQYASCPYSQEPASPDPKSYISQLFQYI